MKTKLIISQSGAAYFVNQIVAVGTAVDHDDDSVTLYSINTNEKQYVLLEMEVGDANDVADGSAADFLLACRGDEVIDLRPGTYHHELFETFVAKAKETQSDD